MDGGKIHGDIRNETRDECACVRRDWADCALIGKEDNLKQDSGG